MIGRRIVVVVATLVLVPCAAHAQKGPRCAVARAGALVVYGAGVPTTPFTLADLQALPRQEVTAKSKDQGSSAYQGVPVGVLLGRATGNDKGRLKHGNMLQYLVAEAADGYRAVLAMPEADTSSQRSAIMVAYRMNGAPLDSASGPLQLVAPLDLEHGRWVRQLECIRVARDPGA